VTRIPVILIAGLLACFGGVGLVYLKTRPETQASVLHVDRVAQAVATTTSVKSFRFKLSMSMSAGGKSFAFGGGGSYDLQHKLVAMTMQVENAPAGSPAVGPMELVLDYSHGFVEYMRAGMLDGHLPAGKTWLKIDVGKVAKKEGVDLDRLLQANDADPTKMLDVLRRSANPVLVGKESVDGVSTSHYTATVDLRRLAALETDDAVRESLRRAIEVSGTATYPVDVWIDSDGYLRRVRTTMVEAPPGAPGTVVTMTATQELSAFGVPANVPVPPADTVADLADLTG
jgi:hypothetical protein